MSSLNITEVTSIHPLYVEVHATGARGGKHEWVVDYDRHNKLTGAYCYKGPACPVTKSQYYPATAAHLIPSEIKDAAWTKFSSTVAS